ncbi:hypothetical protein [Streptomyces catenulae]|uniref:DUF485 domain-containing protein n=1 Tax=Streptomyces catenulae TaxID=66875 RepID=A0ABV2YT97_9ACTN|nr:hypothetical protein [Streptomyces catenulae]
MEESPDREVHNEVSNSEFHGAFVQAGRINEVRFEGLGNREPATRKGVSRWGIAFLIFWAYAAFYFLLMIIAAIVDDHETSGVLLGIGVWVAVASFAMAGPVTAWRLFRGRGSRR